VNDLLSGQIDYMFDSATTMSHIQAGRLKALAVIGPNRLPALPEIKTLAEYGIQGVDAASGWHALFAPAGTPAEIVNKLNAALQPILASDAIKARIVSLGAEPASSTPSSSARCCQRPRSARPIVSAGAKRVVIRWGAPRRARSYHAMWTASLRLARDHRRARPSELRGAAIRI
jgi:hypothetical protein